MKSFDIVAYDYRGETLCPEDTRKALLSDAEMTLFSGLPTEELLDFLADRKNIDRHDERSFDSGDFPKVVFTDQLNTADRCYACDVALT